MAGRYSVDSGSFRSQTEDLMKAVPPGDEKEDINGVIRRLRLSLAKGQPDSANPQVLLVEQTEVDQSLAELKNLLLLAGVSDPFVLAKNLEDIFNLVAVTPVATEKEGAVEIESNIKAFFETGKARVPDFLTLRGAEIPWRGRAETDFTPEERKKILKDFHLFLMRQINDIILDDQKSSSFVLEQKKKLRIKGQFKIDEATFTTNPADSVQTIKRVDQWWTQINTLSPGLASLWEQSYKFVGAHMDIYNTATALVEKLPQGKLDDQAVIDLVSKDILYDFNSVFTMITGVSQKEAGSGREYMVRSEEHNAVLGNIIQQTLVFFDHAYRGANFEYKGRKIKIEPGFPHQTQDTQKMYLECEALIREMVEDQVVSGTLVFTEPNEKEDYIRWGLQQAFDVVWAYGQAFNFDKSATKSAYAEGANALTYHVRNLEGVPSKTTHGSGTSKDKTPVVTNRPIYYPSFLETAYMSAFVKKDDVEIGDSEAAIRHYFEVYLVEKYGDATKKKNSREYMDALGQIPEDICFDTSGNPNYAAISADFVVIQVKGSKTAFGTPGQKLFIRKDAILRKQLSDGTATHLSLKLSAYDLLFRAQLPHFEKDPVSGQEIATEQWHKLPFTSGPNQENYGKFLKYEKQFFMDAASVQGIDPFAERMSDLVQWQVSPALKSPSKTRMVYSTFRNLVGLSEWAARTVLGIQSYSKNTDLGLQIFDSARQYVLIKPESLSEAYDPAGLKKLSDHLFTYYSDSAVKLESNMIPVAGYAPDGSLQVDYVKQDVKRPELFQHLFRNIFESWRTTPYFASRRAFEWTKKLDEASLQPASKVRDEVIAKAKFALEFEQEYMAVISLFIGQFMYVYDPEKEQAIGATSDMHAVIESYHRDSDLRRTIAKREKESGFVQPLFPEDVAIQVALFNSYIKSRAREVYYGINGKYPNETEIHGFLQSLSIPGIKRPDKIDTWGFTPEETEAAMLYLYSAYGITSGPNAGGVAIDWIMAAMSGGVGRFKKTIDQMKLVREQMGIGGLFSGSQLLDKQADKK